MMQIQKPLRWFQNVLGVISGMAPQELAPALQGVLDVGQNGWPLAEVQPQTLVVLPVGVPVNQTLIPQGNFAYSWLLRASVDNRGSASIVTSFAQFYQTGGLSGNTILTWLTVPSLNFAGMQQLFGGHAFVWIPPGYGLQYVAGAATGTAGEMRYDLIRFPAGFRPF